MAVAWRRGFFRVWVILAALWMVVVAIVVAMVFGGTNGGTFGYIEGKGDVLFEYSSPEYQQAWDAVRSTPGTMTRIKFKPVPNISVFVTVRSDPNDYQPLAEHYAPLAVAAGPEKQTQGRIGLIGLGVFWALVVPAIILALGSAVAWALSGFRRHPIRGEEL